MVVEDSVEATATCKVFYNSGSKIVLVSRRLQVGWVRPDFQNYLRV